MRTLAPVRIRGEYNAPQPMTYDGSVWSAAWTDWLAKCRVCAESYGTAEHAEALTWAHGHMHVRHPLWHERTRRIDRLFDTEAAATTWASTDQGKYLTCVFEGWVEG